ncbi:hypothetical protein [Janthinobacterium sp. 17J80-10]|uniref:hypothetical protein n=1 Tax=Janthinobacterium sp. 17J80-10 TaxID=2497863 RepID=UPI001005A10B|nr:hypothetical protein [Janthinobacterium sp. 17J80-10]QAU34676.1 hypothetical protein EKL02_11040 [Janthinobacterium sp. 17J80-10]
MNFVIFVAALFCGSAWAVDVTAKMKFVGEVDGEKIYEGRTRINGRYVIDEDGELNFRPNNSQWFIGFSNEEQALEQLNLNDAVKRLDNTKFCGLTGKAQIEITELLIGQGPARTWKTATLSQVIRKDVPIYMRCKANSSLNRDGESRAAL